MENTTELEGLKAQLDTMRSNKLLDPAYQRKRTIIIGIRVLLLIALAWYFWDKYTWVPYAFVSLLLLDALLVYGYNKWLPNWMQQKIAGVEARIAALERG